MNRKTFIACLSVSGCASALWKNIERSLIEFNPPVFSPPFRSIRELGWELYKRRYLHD